MSAKEVCTAILVVTFFGGDSLEEYCPYKEWWWVGKFAKKASVGILGFMGVSVIRNQQRLRKELVEKDVIEPKPSATPPPTP